MRLRSASCANSGPSHELDSPGPGTSGKRSLTGETLALGEVVTSEKAAVCLDAGEVEAVLAFGQLSR